MTSLRRGGGGLLVFHIVYSINEWRTSRFRLVSMIFFLPMEDPGFSFSIDSICFYLLCVGMWFGCLPSKQTRLAATALYGSAAGHSYRRTADTGRFGSDRSFAESPSRERLADRRIFRGGRRRRRPRFVDGFGRAFHFVDGEPRLGRHHHQFE